MKTVLCYGDSNTWGYDPVTACRFPYDVRYTGRLQHLLGDDYLVVESGLNGRTTSKDDPIEPGRNGLKTIDVCMLSAMPIDLVTIMLGTNDIKPHLSSSAYIASKGVELLAERAHNPMYGVNEIAPRILIISPPYVSDKIMGTDFRDLFGESSLDKSYRFAEHYKEIADLHGYAFLDAAKVCTASDEDAIHLTAESQMRLADALHEKIKQIFA